MDSPPPVIDRICRMVEYTLQRPDADGVRTRALHGPGLGLLRGTLTVDGGLPREIGHGLFAESRSFETWVRFSRSHFYDRKTPDTFGMAVKLLGVRGEKCLDETPGEQDFITVNLPYAWVGNRQHVLDYFIRLAANREREEARRARKQLGERHGRKPADIMPLNQVFRSPDPRKFDWPLLRLWRIITWNWIRYPDPVMQTYNTLTAFRLGEGAMKCLFRGIPVPGVRTSGRYRERLAAGPIRFEFLVQRRTMPDREPVDDVTKPWKSPLVKVGTMTIPPQDFDTDERMALEESISYSPYFSLRAHEPLGSLSEVRRWAYRHSGINRGGVCPFRVRAE